MLYNYRLFVLVSESRSVLFFLEGNQLTLVFGNSRFTVHISLSKQGCYIISLQLFIFFFREGILKSFITLVFGMREIRC